MMTATTRFSLMVMVIALALLPAMAFAQTSKAEPVVAIITSDNGEIYAEYEDGTPIEPSGTIYIDEKAESQIMGANPDLTCVEWHYYIIHGVKIWYCVRWAPGAPATSNEETYHEQVSLIVKVFDDGTVHVEYEDGTIPKPFKTPCINCQTASRNTDSQPSASEECCGWMPVKIGNDVIWICVVPC